MQSGMWDTLASFFIKFYTNYCYMCVEIMSKVQIFSVGRVTDQFRSGWIWNDPKFKFFTQKRQIFTKFSAFQIQLDLNSLILEGKNGLRDYRDERAKDRMRCSGEKVL